jgi:hypothetical protein
MADAMAIDTTVSQGSSSGVADKTSAATSKVSLPGYTGQFEKEAMADLQSRISKDPKFVEKLPKGLSDMYREWATSSDLKSRVTVPDKNAPRETWDQFYRELGRPDGPDKYSFTKPENLPSGLPYDASLEKWFRQKMWDAGVPNDTAKAIFDDWNKTQSERFTAIMAERQKADETSRAAAAKAAIETLTAEYKDALPQMMQLRDAAIARFGGQELVDAFRQARLPSGLTLDNDPRVSKMLIEVGKRMDVDTLVTGAGGSGNGNQPRSGLPTTPHGYALSFPDMEKDPRLRVKAE